MRGVARAGSWLLIGLPAAAQTPLTLADALRLADESNPVIAAARADARAADADWRAARGARLPSLEVSGGAARTTDPVGVFGGKLRQGVFGPADFSIDALNRPAGLTDYSYGARLEQPLYAGGALSAGREAARRAALAGAAGGAEARARVRLEVVRAYYAVPLADAAVAATRRALELAREHAALVRAAVRAGGALESDALRVELFASGLESDLARREADARLARARLAALLGRPDESYEPAEALDADRELPDGLERRDVEAARLAGDAAEAGRRAALASFRPTAGLFASWQQDRGSGGAGRGYYTVGVGVRWTLFDGGRAGATAEAARARADAARARATELADRAATERRGAEARLESARRRVVLSGAAIDSAREVRRVAALRERTGGGSLSDTLDAEGGLLRAELDAQAARYDLLTARAEAAYATGAR